MNGEILAVPYVWALLSLNEELYTLPLTGRGGRKIYKMVMQGLGKRPIPMDR